MCRCQISNVDAVIAIGAVHCNRVEGQRRWVEVAEDLNFVDATTSVDLDLLDVAQLSNHEFTSSSVTGDYDVCICSNRFPCPSISCVYAENLISGVAVDRV